MNLEELKAKIERDLINHPPDSKTQGKMEILRGAYHEVLLTFDNVCKDENSRELSLAFTNLEQSLMWGIAHLARTNFDELNRTEALSKAAESV
jgi:hypothetical protein